MKRVLFPLALLLVLCSLAAGGGAVRAAQYAARLWPPDLGYLPKLALPVLDTLKMSLLGTTLAAVTALPLSYLGCKDLVQNAVLYALTRFALSVMRATPVLVLGVMFVAALGFGMAAGVAGLWFNTSGALGKFMSEALDAADRSVKEAAVIDGASRWQVFLYVLLPMQANAFLSYYLYYIEANFRDAVVLGVVGAGGIGLELIAAVGLFKYGRIGLVVLTIIGVSLILDLLSRKVRQRFLADYGETGAVR